MVAVYQISKKKKKKKNQVSCYQKVGIGGGFWLPEKISPQKIS